MCREEFDDISEVKTERRINTKVTNNPNHNGNAHC